MGIVRVSVKGLTSPLMIWKPWVGSFSVRCFNTPFEMNLSSSPDGASNGLTLWGPSAYHRFLLVKVDLCCKNYNHKRCTRRIRINRFRKSVVKSATSNWKKNAPQTRSLQIRKTEGRNEVSPERYRKIALADPWIRR